MMSGKHATPIAVTLSMTGMLTARRFQRDANGSVSLTGCIVGALLGGWATIMTPIAPRRVPPMRASRTRLR